MKNQEKIAVRKIYKKILEIYPFLNKKEKNIFEKKSKIIVDKFSDGNLKAKETIEELLALFGENIHADIKEISGSKQKPNPKNLQEAKIKKSPSLNIEDRILYITIPSWSSWLGEIDKKLIIFCKKNIEKYDGIIIDVKENQGGSSYPAHEFASIFFKKKVIYGKFMKINKKTNRLKGVIANLRPHKETFIDKPIAILISDKCFSSNEMFIAPFKISKKATLIGQPTGGGSANPISETIEIRDKKFAVRIPTWRLILKEQNRPLEETKIRPDILYKGKNIEKFAKDYLLKILKKS